MSTAIQDARPPFPAADARGTARPAGARRTRLALWLAAAAVLSLAFPIYRAARVARSEATRLERRVERASATAAALSDSSAVATSEGQLAVARSTSEALAGVRDAMATRHVDWVQILGAVGAFDPDSLAITGVAQEGRLLRVQGTAMDDTAVVAYVARLEASGLFSRVSVESIQTVAEATPGPGQGSRTPTPAGAAAGGGATTPAVTRIPGDQYEAADATGTLTVPGTAQVRTFHAAGDVDRARFVAKAGRSYRVTTSALGPGVDTVLTVRTNWGVMTNDDVRPGTLASEVTVTAPARAELDILVEVANRGASGDGQGYTLEIAEVVSTGTPTPAALTATPAPVVTSTSAPTAAATAAPTPTFDLRDAYEPDEAPTTSVATGEVQMRSFYPAEDADRALYETFTGHTYRVSTFGLSPDVDTFLAVHANGTVYVSDDRGPADPSSEVTFQVAAGTATQVVIEITNRGRFGPGQWYRLKVEDITEALTPTAAALMAGQGRWFAVQLPARRLCVGYQRALAPEYAAAEPAVGARVQFSLLLEIAP